MREKQQIRNSERMFFYCCIMFKKAEIAWETDGGPLNPKEIGSEKTVAEMVGVE